MRTPLTLATAVVLIVSSVPAPAQTILGYKWEQSDKGIPESRRLKVTASEVPSPDLIAGDPAANGAVVQIIVNGGTPSSQTIALPGGPRWKRKPSDPSEPAEGWTYRDSSIYGGPVSPVSSLAI